MMKYLEVNWKQANETVKRLQRQMIAAYREGDGGKVNDIQQKIVRSFAARALAVRKVTTNAGCKTSGVDGIIWDELSARVKAIEELRVISENLNSYKPGSVKRVWVPEVNGDKRPLGIPNMKDRAIQALIALAIDPLVEESSDRNSFGFRKSRSAEDAICRIRYLLDKTWSPRWILVAGIENCFDHITHEAILSRTPLYSKQPIEEWLKAGIFEFGTIIESESGTPQGGVISPILCNIALNGLEKAIPDKPKVNVVRYADDFIVTAPTKKFLEKEAIPAIKEFLKQRGLNLSPTKTRIVNIEEDWVKFLGWEMKRTMTNVRLNNISTQDTVLVIRPSKFAENRIKNQIRAITVENKSIKELICEINSVVREWTNYFRGSYHSQIVFKRLGHYIQGRLWAWAKKTHPTRSVAWIKENYIFETENRIWRWGMNSKLLVMDPMEVEISVTSPIKLDLNPYTAEGEEYFKRKITIRDLPWMRRESTRGGTDWLTSYCAWKKRKRIHTSEHPTTTQDLSSTSNLY